ncbi:hypothetical protein PRVXT_001832 [Proteinivorax tanatarense]|uniref:Uncharacterized protein n=1 Tax=Proteinivorax tanatarense TaxID=1260629 RepID=A0AAU7VI72_9FIRM
MKRKQFRTFLKSKQLTEKGITSRVGWAIDIEQKFNLDLDKVCKSSEKTTNILNDIKKSTLLKKRQKSNYEIGLLSYYEFLKSKQTPF